MVNEPLILMAQALLYIAVGLGADFDLSYFFAIYAHWKIFHKLKLKFNSINK